MTKKIEGETLGSTSGNGGSQKRRCVKAKGGSVNLVLGKEVHLNEVVGMAVCILVGKIHGHRSGDKSLHNRVDGLWGNLLGYPPKTFLLACGWSTFVFHSEEDATKILVGSWSWDNSPLFIKH